MRTTNIPSGRRSTGTTDLRAAAAVGALLLAACGAANVRPHFGPLPGAVADTLRAEPAALIRELVRLTEREGLRIAAVSPDEGYLETDWYDTALGRAGGRYTGRPEQIVRLRFFTDDVGNGETALAAEAVYRRTVDPSVSVREREVLVPDDHAGAAILRRILGALPARPRS